TDGGERLLAEPFRRTLDGLKAVDSRLRRFEHLAFRRTLDGLKVPADPRAHRPPRFQKDP
ncbi:hypothetical protein, partial [Halobellus captivus]